MSDVHWLHITNTTGCVGLFLTLSSNCILLAMMSLKTSPVQGVYKRLLMFSCCFTVFYSLVELLIQPLLHIDDDTLFVIQQKRFQMDPYVARLVTSMYCGCYAMSFVLFALQFLYRYISTCKTHLVDCFQGAKFLLWILGALAITLFWQAAAYTLFPQTPRTDESFFHIVHNSYDLDTIYTSYIPYRYFETRAGVREMITLNVIGVVQHIVIIVVSFGTLFFCAATTYTTIIKHKGMSAKTRDLQMQLFRALAVQTAIPMFFMYIPLLFLYLCPLLNLQLGATANYQTIMGQLYPGVDPFAVLFLVSTYRRRLKSWVVCARHEQSGSSLNENSILTPRGHHIAHKI